MATLIEDREHWLEQLIQRAATYYLPSVSQTVEEDNVGGK